MTASRIPEEQAELGELDIGALDERGGNASHSELSRDPTVAAWRPAIPESAGGPPS